MEATIKKITKSYNEKLQIIEHEELDIMQIILPVIKLLEDMFIEIKIFISSYAFRNEDEEIRFFKEIKPQLFSKF